MNQNACRPKNLAVFHLKNCALLHDYSTEVDRQAYEISEYSTHTNKDCGICLLYLLRLAEGTQTF